MKKYDFQKIDELLQPIMEMMREEFPNDCKLIVGTNFSQIVFEHTYLTFQSDEMKKPLHQTEPGKTFSSYLENFLAAMRNQCEEIKNTEESEE